MLNQPWKRRISNWDTPGSPPVGAAVRNNGLWLSAMLTKAIWSPPMPHSYELSSSTPLPDYAMLHPGQKIVLTTDAFPGEQFQGQVERIAPVFKQATRQARVELKIDNPGQRLKPGMFIRAVVVLDRKLDATIVPQQALIRRDDVTGLFLVSDDGRSVSWHEVVVGIRNGERVQVTGDGLSGRVVILGQQLLNDGAAITIPAEQSVPTAVRKEAVR